MVKPRDSDRSERRGCVPLESYLGLLTAANVVLCAVLKIATWGYLTVNSGLVFYLPLLLVFALLVNRSLKCATEVGKRSAIISPLFWANVALLLAFLLQVDTLGGPAWMTILAIALGRYEAEGLLTGWLEQNMMFWNVGVFLPTAFVLGWLRRKLERPLVPPA